MPSGETIRIRGVKFRDGSFYKIQGKADSALAEQYWAPYTEGKHLPFEKAVIDNIYIKDILGSRFAIRRVVMLELSQYLERYLWPNYTPAVNPSHEHLMSIIVMVNEKFRERVPAWDIFKVNTENVEFLFHQVLEACLKNPPEEGLGGRRANHFKELTAMILFLNHCFNSMENEILRMQVQKLVTLPMWTSLYKGRRELEFKRFPEWKTGWKKIQKRDSKRSSDDLIKLSFERTFLRKMISHFEEALFSVKEDSPLPEEELHYCERFMELLIDLENLLPTRRFFNTVLDDSQIVIRSSMSSLVRKPEGKLFRQLLDMLRFYQRFEINDATGDPLTDRDMMKLHYASLVALQRAVFIKYPEMKKFALLNVAAINSRESLEHFFETLSRDKLHSLANSLALIPMDTMPEDEAEALYPKDFLVEMLVSRHEKRLSQLEKLNEMPLYPTEQVIWDENIVPSEYFAGDGVLALPKLNLQFLTLHDYLLRNFNLFRLESTFEIRQDIESTIRRMKPWRTEDGKVMFGGWARMAQPISTFLIVEVASPQIGERRPARVRADVAVTLDLPQNIKQEWLGLRKHDICFLVTVRPGAPPGTYYRWNESFVPQVGLIYVRGCEIEGLIDDQGKLIDDNSPDEKPMLAGDKVTYRVWLDCNQYREDMEVSNNGGEDCYETFNVILRRRQKENNFKAVLETIRSLMNTNCVVPNWLHDIILGYGDPSAAHWTKMPDRLKTLDFNDTFLDAEHLKESFPGCTVVPRFPDRESKPPFRLHFQYSSGPHVKDTVGTVELQKEIIEFESHVIPNRGPYAFVQPKLNSVRFTPTQLEAIRSGMQPGLTMVVGPPGSGKTDVAVQIISNIYHNFPNQRTLIVTHSNQALNQLFEKIMALDVDERHLLRLGHGEEALDTEKDFSRYGRVNFVLTKRLQLLAEVARLQETLGVTGEAAYTCETARYFFLNHVVSRWSKFVDLMTNLKNKETTKSCVCEHFPFHEFFSNAPQPVFKGADFDDDYNIAVGCFRYLERIFQQLEEFRPFELLRSGADRSRYLLVKEAKIIAMTCTHAALKRSDLVSYAFTYDNILMEESAQILEIETFIPLLLQNPIDGHNRLKRWIMIGDHHQLPPVIKNMAFQRYSNMEQSLFSRFVRLGVPTVDLDAQGRARPSICSLYNWRYKKLDNLPHVHSSPEYLVANAGFRYVFQLIDVGDFNGTGESEPNPYFYQNLGEAEYVVAVYMYMRLLGYPAEKITVLTTYNGQKHLLRDVIKRRCTDNPLFGNPHKVTTVDKYQGQQNDYILLSLVRTKAVGHLRDVRRLVVAMSRARLGLYVFARASLFRNCFELTPAFNVLRTRPLDLHLAPEEKYPCKRKPDEEPYGSFVVVKSMPEMANYVYELYSKFISSLPKPELTPVDKALKADEALAGSVITIASQHPGADSDDEEVPEEIADATKVTEKTSETTPSLNEKPEESVPELSTVVEVETGDVEEPSTETVPTQEDEEMNPAVEAAMPDETEQIEEGELVEKEDKTKKKKATSPPAEEVEETGRRRSKRLRKS
ncbi:unnamed protein product [Notodromas monacha]|uniref:RNA helicase aquarius n=1 Tax=Notodromas monacha TaxID=399045 RepID=A0A7R9BIT6_9CRUS|nr:unnamed protein product [Notodromas monacha]CAG0914886.1 unnamed protein product [Notodromas monacha]